MTFHRCINYGSYWQARGLVEALQGRGHDAVLLDHYSEQVNLAEWRCAMRPVLPTYVPPSDYPLYKEKTRRFFAAFDQLPLSPCFPLEDPSKMDNYDLVIVGSDEVWNLTHPWYSYCPLFYGMGLRTERLASYAASFGNYPASAGLPHDWADMLRRFDHISIRDENSRAIINNALGFDPAMVLDPCLQFPLPVPQPEHATDRPEPYVAVYGHNFSDWFSTQARNWAKQHGYQLVSIGYRNDWADQQWLTAGPHDFATFIAGAQAVVTNFFHGCVFSLRNERPFVCEKTPYRSIKIRDLMSLIGAEERLLDAESPATAYEARLSEPVSSAVLKRIEQMRERSNAYLDQVLN